MAPTGSPGLAECQRDPRGVSALGTQASSESYLGFFQLLLGGRRRFVSRRLDGLKLSHQGWCLLPVREGKGWRGEGPLPVGYYEALMEAGHQFCGVQKFLPSGEIVLPHFLPPTLCHSPNLLLLFQRLSYSRQTKQSCLEVRLWGSDGLTFSPATLIGPRIGCKGADSSQASAVGGAPRSGQCALVTFSGKMTALAGGRSTQFTDRTAEAGVPPASLSREGGVTRNFVPSRHGPQRWPRCLWTDTVERVVGAGYSRPGIHWCGRWADDTGCSGWI